MSIWPISMFARVEIGKTAGFRCLQSAARRSVVAKLSPKVLLLMDFERVDRLYEAYELVINTLELNDIVLYGQEEEVLAAIISVYEADPLIKDIFSIAGRSLDKLLFRSGSETLH